MNLLYVGERVILLQGNCRIHKVIYSSESSQNRTVTSMAEELGRFFSMVRTGRV